MGGHQGALPAAPGRQPHRPGGHRRLAAAHIALDQPVHHPARGHVLKQLPQGALLGPGRGKGQQGGILLRRPVPAAAPRSRLTAGVEQRPVRRSDKKNSSNTSRCLACSRASKDSGRGRTAPPSPGRAARGPGGYGRADRRRWDRPAPPGPGGSSRESCPADSPAVRGIHRHDAAGQLILPSGSKIGLVSPGGRPAPPSGRRTHSSPPSFRRLAL